ncbi:MAG: phospholipase D-like domain-containing protein [Thermoanaerobaculia bacterium]
MKRRRRVWIPIVLIVLGTALAVVLGLNFGRPEKHVEARLEHRYRTSDPQFHRAMGALLGPAILPGNRVEYLENGDEIFPAMLAAIAAAEHSITFETYIYWSGEIGKAFGDALAGRARAGVRVHVLLDWAGSGKMDDALLEELRASGVEVEKYHPLKWYHLSRLNQRTHRKLLTVDGRTGFTGGVGIADKWSGDGEDPEHWRDAHFRIEGPAVAQIQAVFADNWLKVSGEVLDGEAYFPALFPLGDVEGQMFSSSPTGGSESMRLMYLMAIAAAESSIDISASYFVPDGLTRRTLLDALHRGVRIRVIVPGEHMDAEIVRAASRAHWGELLAAGAEIYEYSPTMYHCKVFTVDGNLVSVGSTNLDNRSFALNDEANLNLYDTEFAKRMTAVFEVDLARSRRVTFQAWSSRPLKERAAEWMARPFESQL